MHAVKGGLNWIQKRIKLYTGQRTPLVSALHRENYSTFHVSPVTSNVAQFNRWSTGKKSHSGSLG